MKWGLVMVDDDKGKHIEWDFWKCFNIRNAVDITVEA
jgi:hypothetical protein